MILTALLREVELCCLRLFAELTEYKVYLAFHSVNPQRGRFKNPCFKSGNCPCRLGGSSMLLRNVCRFA